MFPRAFLSPMRTIDIYIYIERGVYIYIYIYIYIYGENPSITAAQLHESLLTYTILCVLNYIKVLIGLTQFLQVLGLDINFNDLLRYELLPGHSRSKMGNFLCLCGTSVAASRIQIRVHLMTDL
jgi:hypothetical protein